MTRANPAVFVLPDLALGGAQPQIIYVVRELRRRGHDARLVVLGPANGFWLDQAREVPNQFLGYRSAVAALPDLRAAIRALTKAIVLSSLPNAVAASELARLGLRDVRHVAIVHDFPLEEWQAAPTTFRRTKLRAALALTRRADHVVAVSRAVADQLTKVLGFAPDRVSVIANGLAASSYPLPPRPRQDPPTILYGGRLEPRKNVSTLIEAFALIVERRPCRLVIAGSGTERDALEREARRRLVLEHVSFSPPIQPFSALIDGADVLAMPSAREAFGLVLLEAMARGVPVAAGLGSGGPDDIIGSSGAAGLLVPAHDPHALARALEALIDEPPATERLLERAAAFSLDHTTDRFEELIKRLAV